MNRALRLAPLQLELASDECLPGRFIVRPSSKPNGACAASKRCFLPFFFFLSFSSFLFVYWGRKINKAKRRWWEGCAGFLFLRFGFAWLSRLTTACGACVWIMFAVALGLTIKEEDGQFTHALLRDTDEGWSCSVEGITYVKPTVTELLVSMGDTLLFPSDADPSFGTMVDLQPNKTLSPLEKKKLELRRRKAELEARKRKNQQTLAAPGGNIGGGDGGSSSGGGSSGGGNSRATAAVARAAASRGGGGGGGAVPSGVIEEAVVLEDYDAEEDTELTLREGERLWVFKKADDWSMGAVQSRPDVRKWFPADFVRSLGPPKSGGGGGAAKAAPKKAAASGGGGGGAGGDLGLTDLDVLDDLLDMDGGDLDAALDDDFALGLDLGGDTAGSGGGSGNNSGRADDAAPKKKKQLVQVFYADDLYTTVALEDSDTSTQIINTLCKKFKFWEHDKVNRSRARRRRLVLILACGVHLLFFLFSSFVCFFFFFFFFLHFLFCSTFFVVVGSAMYLRKCRQAKKRSSSLRSDWARRTALC